jgi:ubiquinone/menaquinone biosynthesis C-methylase UbiE
VKQDRRAISERFDRRAATYDQSGMHQWQARQAARLLAPVAGQSLLDIATGTGLAARAVSDLTGSTGRVVGIDVSHQMLRVAAAQPGYPQHRYVRADAQRLPFQAAVFDAVLCVAAIPYLPDLDRAVAEWRRVTRHGGGLVFTTPAKDGIPVLRLLRHAAAEHGLQVTSPDADLDSPQHITTRAHDLALAVETVQRQTFPEPLDADPRAAFDHILGYGFADPLRTTTDRVGRDVYRSYRDAYLAERAAGPGEHTVLFTKCHFPHKT